MKGPLHPGIPVKAQKSYYEGRARQGFLIPVWIVTIDPHVSRSERGSMPTYLNLN